MDEQEVQRQFERWSELYDIRVERHKSICTHNPPGPIMKQGLKLIEEASKMIAVYGLPYQQVLLKLPEVRADAIIKEAIEAGEREEVIKADNERWDNLEHDFIKKYIGRMSSQEDKLAFGTIIADIFTEIRQKAILL